MTKVKGYIPTTFLLAVIALGNVAAYADGIIVTRGSAADGIIVTKSNDEPKCEESKGLAADILDTVIGFVKTGIIVTKSSAPCGIIVTKTGIIVT